jgi:hypothetical protein
MTPNLFLLPILDEAEALAGVLDREVIRPTAEHQIDQLHDPASWLRLLTAEHASASRNSAVRFSAELQTQLRNKMSRAPSLNLYAAVDLKLQRRAVGASPKLVHRGETIALSKGEIASRGELQ